MQTIQLDHGGRSIKPTLPLILPVDVMVESGFLAKKFFHSKFFFTAVFTHLDVASLGKISQVCKAWHAISIHGKIWKSAYLKMWGEESGAIYDGYPLDTMDWLHILVSFQF